MALLFAFEDFASPAVARPEPQRPEDLPGYAEGHAAAMAEVAAHQSHLSQDVVQAISDISFGFAEARLHVMTSLEPLFRVLVDRLLPATLPDSFRTHVVATLIAAAKADIAQPFHLTLHPKQIESVAAILPPTLSALVTLTADGALSRHSATIRHGRMETAIDHDALQADIVQALSALFDHNTESKANG